MPTMTFVYMSLPSSVRCAASCWSPRPPHQDTNAANHTPPAPERTERKEAAKLQSDVVSESKHRTYGRTGLPLNLFGMNRVSFMLPISTSPSPLPLQPSLPITTTTTYSFSPSYENDLDENTNPDKAETLYDVILPGTHDSAAYAARPDLVSRLTPTAMRFPLVRKAVSSVQTDFALTQTLTVFEQLRAGARFLDIRVTKRPGDDKFWTHHGMVLCMPLSEILEQINQFHDYYNRRRSALPSIPYVPVVSVFRWSALSSHECRLLAVFVHSKLKHDVFEGDANALRNTPLSSLPPNIVAGLDNTLLDLSWGTDVWVNTYVADTKISFLSKTIHASMPRFARDSLLILGWTVTPSAVDIVLRVLTRGILRPSVLAAAACLNSRFHDFAKRHVKQLKLSTNVVFFDAFSISLATEVLSLNHAPFNSLSIDSVSHTHDPG